MKIAAFLPELLRHLFKKPATVDYPFQKLVVPKDFRGTPFLHPELCIVCRACERDCPAEAIEITSVNEAEKRFKMVIHNDRCIHCAQCVDSCPTTPRPQGPMGVRPGRPEAQGARRPRHAGRAQDRSPGLKFSLALVWAG
jgi:ferredoxin